MTIKTIRHNKDFADTLIQSKETETGRERDGGGGREREQSDVPPAEKLVC